MKTALPLALLAPLLLAQAPLPTAAADHGVVCGGPDGYVVEPYVAMWLRPGCLGAAAGLGRICRETVVVFHGEVVGQRAYASNCGAGAWLP